MSTNWSKRLIGDIATFSQGIQIGLEKQKTEPEDGFVRFIRIIDYTQNTDDKRYVKDPGKKYHVDCEDIVMVRYGSPGLIGRGKEGVIANNLFKIAITKSEVTRDYLSLFLSQEHIQKYLSTQGSSTMPALNFGQLKTVEIDYPPLQEQQQIVAILDEAFEAIDQAKANIEKNIQNAKELFQSKLNEIFSFNAEGWKQKRLPDIALEFGRGKSKHRPRNDVKLYGGVFPFLQTGDVRNVDKFITSYSQTYNEIGLKQSKLWPKGTICITIAANIAETAILDFEGCFPDSIIGLVVDENIANRDYAFYALQFLKAELQAQGKGSAQDNINLGTFQNQHFPFPSLDIQMEMVDILDKLKDQCNLLEDSFVKKSLNLDDLKKSILQKAFAGELTTKYTTA